LLAVIVVALRLSRVRVTDGGCSVMALDFVPPLSVVETTTAVAVATGMESTGAELLVPPAGRVRGCLGITAVFVLSIGTVITAFAEASNDALAVAGLVPPVREAGDTLNVVIVGGTTVNDVCRVTLPWFAMIVGVYDVGPLVAVMLNVALFAPAGMLTSNGKLTEEYEVPWVNWIVVPDNAVPSSVTVPVPVVPVFSVLGDTAMDASSAGWSVTLPCAVTDPTLAVMVACVSVATVVEVSVNWADEAPAATVTDEGTVAADVPEDSDTEMGFTATPVSDTVPVALAPPVIEEGEKVTAFTCAGRMCRTAAAVD